MNPEEFIPLYENALGSQNWSKVDPLISENAVVTFSNGTVHIGKENVRKAFENNFSLIKSESYHMENVKWLKKEETHAVFIFQYVWSGLINDKLVSGSGNGTSVLSKEGEIWRLLSEHLGSK